MPGSAVPAIVGVILLVLVGLLALLTDPRSAEARWFALLNLLLAASSVLGASSTSMREGAPDRALAFGRLANAAATLAFVALYLQLSSLARSTQHPAVDRLRRFAPAAIAVTLVAGGLSALSSLVVRAVVWNPGLGYRPVFGVALPLVLATTALVGGWAASLLVTILRHGTARRRREAAWMAVGVLIFDLFGLVLLAMVLPRLGLTEAVAWAPASLATGSVIMLGAMVLTRQHEIDKLESNRSWGRRVRGSPAGGSPEPSCRACSNCGAMLPAHAAMAHCPLDGGEIVAGLDPWPGRTIDERYAIEAFLGAGGMGRVYRARHLKLGTPIAVKLLNGDLAADAHTVERFAREARSALRIRSPHVVMVHDLGELPPGIPFLTMELIAGVSLKQLLADGRRLTEPAVALLGVQLASGLGAAHDHGVIHRDLKPDNVLIDAERDADVAKIVDFGLARIVDESLGSGEMTTLGRIFGTPAYISPEQASGRVADARSDIYALGAVLYRARAGRKPFEGTALELLARHISDTPPPLGEAPLDRLILRMLAKEPTARPALTEIVRVLADLTRDLQRLELMPIGPDGRGTDDPTLPASFRS